MPISFLEPVRITRNARIMLRITLIKSGSFAERVRAVREAHNAALNGNVNRL